MKNEFISRKKNFQGTEGYMVSQMIQGKPTCEQFVPADNYEEFCKSINTIPRAMTVKAEILTDFSREFPRPLRRWDESASVVRYGYFLNNHIATADKQGLQGMDKRAIISLVG